MIDQPIGQTLDLPLEFALNQPADQSARRQAIDAPGSVLVQAPAGSGKTTLLAQRYLRLLATVDAPERILALTFTRRAAQEMRERVLQALHAAAAPERPAQMNPRTWELGLAARCRMNELGLDLGRHPSRLSDRGARRSADGRTWRTRDSERVGSSSAPVTGAMPMMYDRFDMYAFGPVHMLVIGLILIIPFWQLFSKAGYSGWWSLLMIIPLVNLIALYVLAFSSWPVLSRRDQE
jgi:hypothetical protein